MSRELQLHKVCSVAQVDKISLFDKHILVFDSGVGGLSILKSLCHSYFARYTYVLDHEFFPYSDKDSSSIIDRSLRIIKSVCQKQPIDLIVVACNTVTTLAISHLRTELGVPIVGVVPPIKPAASLSESGCIGVLATPITAEGEYLQKLISSYAQDCRVVCVGSKELVSIAESNFFTANICVDSLARELSSLDNINMDTLVLGCTHFHHISRQIKACIGSSVKVIDCTQSIVNHIKVKLSLVEKPFSTQELCVEVLSTKVLINKQFGFRIKKYICQ